MHAGAAHLLQRGDLADDHLGHAGRAQVHRGVALDHDHDVAEGRDVGAARGRGAEQAADLGHPARQPDLVVEDVAGAATAGEELHLVGDAGAGRVDEPEHRQLVPEGQLGEADDLLDGAGAPGARLHRRVVGHHGHGPAVHGAGAGHHPVGGEVLGRGVGQEGVLDEGAVVQEQGQPVPHEQLVLALELVADPLEVAGKGPFGGLGQPFLVRGHGYSRRMAMIATSSLIGPLEKSRAASSRDLQSTSVPTPGSRRTAAAMRSSPNRFSPSRASARPSV